MQVKEIGLVEANEISDREESHFFDNKALDISGQKIQKIAVAFANADGGEFIIGIADKKDEPDISTRWQGAISIEDLNGKLQALFEITPSPDIRYELLKCPEKHGYALKVNIEKSSQIHKTAADKVYQRHGAQSLPITDPEKIMQLSFAKGSTSYEDQLLKNVLTEQIIESKEILSFLESFSPKTDPLEFCINQNLIDYKTWEVKVVSTLLFHPSPSAMIPKKCAVKVSRYETREDEPEREHLAEQKTIEGSLNQLILSTVKTIEDIMSNVKIWTVDGLKSVNYPPEAIWEVIVNALIHRDYSISDDIQILIYNNRIEILSPGKLPGYVTIENILDARYARNSKIVRTLNRYRNAPNKDMGEGLNTTFQKMKEWGLKEPKITEDGNYVKVVLPHTPIATPSEAILKFLEKNEKITNSQARDITGIKSENLVKVEFYKLRDEGLIERIPELKGPKSAWRLLK